MVIQEQVPALQSLLRNAAANRATVSFTQVFELFDVDAAPHDVYDTLEAACVQLADWSAAIYSALLAKSGSQVPGDGFYDIFQVHRNGVYLQIAGSLHVRELGHQHRRKMAAFERDRVYTHAAR